MVSINWLLLQVSWLVINRSSVMLVTLWVEHWTKPTPILTIDSPSQKKLPLFAKQHGETILYCLSSSQYPNKLQVSLLLGSNPSLVCRNGFRRSIELANVFHLFQRMEVDWALMRYPIFNRFWCSTCVEWRKQKILTYWTPLSCCVLPIVQCRRAILRKLFGMWVICVTSLGEWPETGWRMLGCT